MVERHPKVPADRHSVVSSTARGIPTESSASTQSHAPGWHLLTLRAEEQEQRVPQPEHGQQMWAAMSVLCNRQS